MDENKDGIADYTFRNPDFNFGQFRSNFVIRWEYTPGSTLFLVWSQDRTESQPWNDRNGLGDLSQDLFSVKPYNIFLLKFTYRFLW